MRRVRKGEFNPGELVPGTRYRVTGLLGVGGMGLVYEVEHLELGKRFVLKALLSDLANREDIVARLRNEQRALGRLQHPNIIAVTDAGVTSTNLPFFVMERLEGETLGARLRKNRRLPVIEAIAIARGVLEGLSAAHEIGVVHRDIKPQNIFLSSGSLPKILDFGVAKVADAASVITARGVAIGTPRYMSPEQVGGEDVDGRSDLYAVGLLLFETIAGRGPFDDVRDANEMLLAHLGKPAPRLAGLAPGVTRELDALVASLLAKSPADRPPTARAAAAALAGVQSRFGGGANLEAPTPLVSYSSKTDPVLIPGTGARSLTTRPDGVAAREAPTIANPTLPHGTTELVLDTAQSGATRAETPHAPGGTLYDPSSRVVTVAHSKFEVPMDAFRTERLEPIPLPPPSGDEPTHTRVPATPSDGSPSLVPVRVESPRSQRARSTALWLVGAVGAVVLGSSFVALRAPTESTPAEEPRVAASREGHSEPVPAPPASARARDVIETKLDTSNVPSPPSTPRPTSAPLTAAPASVPLTAAPKSAAAPSVAASKSALSPPRTPSSGSPRKDSADSAPASASSAPKSTSGPRPLPGSGL
jgi:serine/threonine-protein kinase